MWLAASALAAAVVILAGVLLYWSPGELKPFVDDGGGPLPGSLAEKIRVEINGVPQGMFIQSKDVTNPVLLFVHGGPGMPEYFLTHTYPTGLEEVFTVVWWEQRGAGLSYDGSMRPETLTVEQLVDDTLAVTNYLRVRFGQDKIYLLGHSWGSFIGIQAAAQAPELYHAYIGMAQSSYQLRSEVVAYEYMLEQYRANGSADMVRRLEAAPVRLDSPLPAAYDGLRDDAMHRLGVGTTREMKSVVSGIFLPVWQVPDYTLGEKINIWRGKFFSKSILWNGYLATDLTRTLTELELPVYFLHGRHDYTVAYPEAKAYFDLLKAPLKGFYTFEQSAHSPLFEEPAKALSILQADVVAGRNSLADAN
jgi:pimeloyl-ACP methyl ester carboxylesterase